jgi:hypothetical protein
VDNEELWILFQIDQQRITALDTIMIAIRGWTVTLVSAIAGFSLSRDDSKLLMAGLAATFLFGYLDLRYRRTQLLHARRTTVLEQVIAPDYRLRSHDAAPDPGLTDSRLYRYRSSLSFYVVIFVLQLTLWLLI